MTAFITFILLILPSIFFTAQAGDFSVTPISLNLDRSAKTAAVTVTNDADQPLNLQMQLSLWTQDQEGKDQYEPSNDLTYFPRMAKLGPKEQQLIRVGVRVPAMDQEKNYRLFIEEIPEPLKPGEKRGAAIAVAIRFGAPIFLKPLQETPKGKIDQIEIKNSELKLRIRNTGNVHFVIQSITATNKNFTKSIQGWYLLPGAARTYQIPLGADGCRHTGNMQITVKTDRLELQDSTPINAAGCTATTSKPSKSKRSKTRH